MFCANYLNDIILLLLYYYYTIPTAYVKQIAKICEWRSSLSMSAPAGRRAICNIFGLLKSYTQYIVIILYTATMSVVSSLKSTKKYLQYTHETKIVFLWTHFIVFYCILFNFKRFKFYQGSIINALKKKKKCLCQNLTVV